MMQMKVQDTYGNTTLAPLQVEVYAPVPQIQTLSSTGMLFGLLDEAIGAEPIHLFRIREGTAISLLSPDRTLTTPDGRFFTGTLFSPPGGATLSYS